MLDRLHGEIMALDDAAMDHSLTVAARINPGRRRRPPITPWATC